MRTAHPQDRTTLLLNAHWVPINVATARATISHLLTGRARAVDRFHTVHEDGGGKGLGNSWFSRRHEPAGENSIYFDDQPALRTANDAWPIPTIALTTSKFYRKPSRSGSITLQKLARTYGYTCQICGDNFHLRDLTIEHVVPRSMGGLTEESNVLLTCKKCNCRKGSIFPYSDTAGVDLRNKIKPIMSFNFDFSERREEWAPFLIHK